jgi:hypothetical protein
MLGLTPDTIIMNPLAWAVLLADPELQSVIRNSTIMQEKMPGGEGAPGFGQSFHGGLGLWSKSTGWNWNSKELVPTPPLVPPATTGGREGSDPWSWGLNPMGANFVMSGGMFPGPVRILVTPTVYIDSDGFVNPNPGGGGGLPASGTLAVTDIIMASSQYCGITATPAGAVIKFDEWNDPSRDIRNIKASAQWAMAILAQGKGINIARKIVIDRNYAFSNVNSITITDPISKTTTFASA